MQGINLSAVRPLFMATLFGTAAGCAALLVAGLASLDEPGSTLLVAGGATYLLGAILVTAAYNVPLNNRLAAADPADPGIAALWRDYLRRWTLGNHVRTVASAAATVLLTLAAR
jgi:uncharacterized membrane protein